MKTGILLSFAILKAQVLNDLIYRVSSAATSPLRFISYLGNNTKIHFNTYNENIFLKKELEISKIQVQINKRIEDRLSTQQRQFFLKEQLKEIKKKPSNIIGKSSVCKFDNQNNRSS